MAEDQQGHIEIDSDADSTLGSDIASSSTSLASSLLKFEFEYGRRYHAYQAGAYKFPNDEEELSRMDFEHQGFLIMLDDRLLLAPLEEPQRILDLGTGTGIWAIQTADLFPSAHVIGIDLSPVQPTWVPPNVEFQIDDLELDWTFQKNYFDLIYWRELLASVSDYPKLFGQAFEHIRPGGYLEVHEIDPGFYSDDDSIPEGSSALLWSKLFYEACEKMGRKLVPLDQYRKLMEDAGFVNIREVHFKRPQNTWAKDKKLKRVGMYTLVNHLNGIHAFTIGLFTRVLGWSPEEVEVLCAKCRNEWKDTKIHGYQKVLFLVGQKPPVVPKQDDEQP